MKIFFLLQRISATNDRDGIDIQSYPSDMKLYAENELNKAIDAYYNLVNDTINNEASWEHLAYKAGKYARFETYEEGDSVLAFAQPTKPTTKYLNKIEFRATGMIDATVIALSMHCIEN